MSVFICSRGVLVHSSIVNGNQTIKFMFDGVVKNWGLTTRLLMRIGPGKKKRMLYSSRSPLVFYALSLVQRKNKRLMTKALPKP